MKNWTKVLVCSFLIISMTSCATIFQNHNDITVSTTHGPLQIRVQDAGGTNEVRTTPFIYDTSRYRDVEFTVISDEYESQKFVVERKIRWLMFFLDLITPFCVGLVIDFSSGKIYEHETQHLIINNENLMRKKAEAERAGEKDFVARLDFELIGLDKEKEPSRILAHREIKFARI